MIVCPQCHSEKPDEARFCDECGCRMTEVAASSDAAYAAQVPEPAFLSDPPFEETVLAPKFDRAVITTLDTGIDETGSESDRSEANGLVPTGDAISLGTLTIERGDSPGTVFEIRNPISVIGRWDADNGIFPDIDLDAYDPDAKVSRKHAKIIIAIDKVFVEDLGSTNGTYINRGRRLLPGTPQQIADGDEVIVGKTFLRFKLGQ